MDSNTELVCILAMLDTKVEKERGRWTSEGAYPTLLE
jgi:hypothetical protein